MNWRKEFVAEFIGTAMLLATVVGSGIMGERLAGGNVAVALLAGARALGLSDGPRGLPPPARAPPSGQLGERTRPSGPGLKDAAGRCCRGRGGDTWRFSRT